MRAGMRPSHLSSRSLERDDAREALALADAQGATEATLESHIGIYDALVARDAVRAAAADVMHPAAEDWLRGFLELESSA